MGSCPARQTKRNFDTLLSDFANVVNLSRNNPNLANEFFQTIVVWAPGRFNVFCSKQNFVPASVVITSHHCWCNCIQATSAKRLAPEHITADLSSTLRAAPAATHKPASWCWRLLPSLTYRWGSRLAYTGIIYIFVS